MSDNKKYYYLKLKDNFFDSEEIKVLEGTDNGYKYTNILLKMYLKSIKRDGLLIFNERIPYNPQMIATVTNHNINDVKQALVLFQEMGLMEILSNGSIYMLDIQNFIGKSTTEADRIRSYRNKIEEKKDKLLNGIDVDLIDDNSGPVQMYDKCTPEIEIEIELDIDLDKDLDKKIEKEIIPYKEILEHLSNVKEMPQGYKLVNGNKKDIKARWNEGYRLDDFIHVIDVKAEEWLVEPKRGEQDTRVWVRPSTLFGNKFDQYLNQEVEEKEEEVSYKYKTIDDIDLKEVGEVDF